MNNLCTSPPKFLRFLQKKFPPPIFFMVHLLHRLYGVDAPAHTHPFNGSFSGTTQVSRYQNGKTNLDFTEAGDSEWQLHQLGHMQDCT